MSRKKDQIDEIMHCCPPPSQTCPQLIIVQGEHLQTHIFFSVENNHYLSRTIPELRRKYLLASYQGWLFLADSFSPDFYLFNPLTKEKFQLPPLKHKYQLEKTMSVDYEKAKYILSRLPPSPECHVLLICGGLMLFCKLGDNGFVAQSTKFGDDYLTAAVVFEGKIYALLKPSCKIVTINFVDSKVQVSPLIDGGRYSGMSPHPRLLTPKRSEDYLIEFFGELLYIRKIYSPFFSKEVSDFQIFRINLCKMAYEEMDDGLGNNTIFLSNGRSFSVPAQSRIVGNSIYYTHPTDKNLYVYEIEDRSRTILLPCPNEGSDWFGQCWVMHC